MKRKNISSIIIMIFCLQLFVPSIVWADPRILLDPVQNRYTGSEQGTTTISSIQFRDVSERHWANEPITRMGALQVIKGYNRRFEPSRSITQEEALVFIIRGMGLEREAIEIGSRYPDLWSEGYIQVAMQTGLITPAQRDNLQNFASREQVAQWVVSGIEFLNPTFVLGNNSLQSIQQYADGSQISSDKRRAVDIVIQKGIMQGKSSRRFDPKGTITRAEMAQVLANMGDLYYQGANIIRKYGKVGAVQDQMMAESNSDLGMRIFRVRTKEGTIDEFIYERTKSPTGVAKEKNAVVYKNRQINGLLHLQEGDEIEYLVDGETQTLLYVYVMDQDSTQIVEGILQPLDQLHQGKLSIRDSSSQLYTYSLAQGLYHVNEQTGKGTIIIGKDEHPISIEEAPVGSKIQLTLQNNVIVDMKYIGHPILVTELRGVVKEIGLNYITFTDNNGNEVTKNFYRNEIQVTKLPYYEAEDQIGYIREIFPDFRYDPAQSQIDSLELGDVITVQLDPYNLQYIKKIHASGHYMMKYGKVNNVLLQKEGEGQIYITYENGDTERIQVPSNVWISKNKQKIAYTDILPGDWIKVLVNQGIIEPGYVVETVKEITVDGKGHHIENIYRGQLTGIFTHQNQFLLQNAQRLTKRGWEDYQQTKALDISKAQQVEYYDDDRRVSLDYVNRFLNQHNGEVYIATEEYYGEERIAKVTFRYGREQSLGDQTVIYADGTGSFKVLSHSPNLQADKGTIIRRHGRLVDPENIMVTDYAQIILNGENQVAVIDIKEEPGIEGLQVLRGRIAKIKDGQSFQVQSFATLQGMKWSYYPIERVFSTDYKTLFYDETGQVDSKTFIDYTDKSKIDKVYTIITHGDQALYVIDHPYVQEGIQGEIYEIENRNLSLKEVQVYDRAKGSWSLINQKNRTAPVTIENNTILIKNGRVIHSDELEKGDKVRVMTTTKLTNNQNNQPITAYIILVEG